MKSPVAFGMVGLALLWASPASGQGCPGRTSSSWGLSVPVAYVSQDGEPTTTAFRGGAGGWVDLTSWWSVDADYAYQDFRSASAAAHRFGAGTVLTPDRRIRPCLELRGLATTATGLGTGEHYRAFAGTVGLGLAGPSGVDSKRVVPFAIARLVFAGSDAALFGFDFSESGVGGGGQVGVQIGEGLIGIQLSASRYWLDDDLGPHPLGDGTVELVLLVRPGS